MSIDVKTLNDFDFQNKISKLQKEIATVSGKLDALDNQQAINDVLKKARELVAYMEGVTSHPKLAEQYLKDSYDLSSDIVKQMNVYDIVNFDGVPAVMAKENQPFCELPLTSKDVMGRFNHEKMYYLNLIDLVDKEFSVNNLFYCSFMVSVDEYIRSVNSVADIDRDSKSFKAIIDKIGGSATSTSFGILNLKNLYNPLTMHLIKVINEVGPSSRKWYMPSWVHLDGHFTALEPNWYEGEPIHRKPYKLVRDWLKELVDVDVISQDESDMYTMLNAVYALTVLPKTTEGIRISLGFVEEELRKHMDKKNFPTTKQKYVFESITKLRYADFANGLISNT